jgi:hypothetical protein
LFPECDLNVPWTLTSASSSVSITTSLCLQQQRTECSLNASWMFPECALNVPWMFPECSLNVPWMWAAVWAVKAAWRENRLRKNWT